MVAVANGYDFVADPAEGVYEVSGTATFTVAAGTSGVVPTGYKIETWDATAGAWTNPRYGEGASYAYTSAGGEKVLLTWRKINPLVIVVR